MITNDWTANRRNLLQSTVLHYNGQNPIFTILPTSVYYSLPFLPSLLSSNNLWFILLSSDLPSIIYYSIPFDSFLFHSIPFHSILHCVIPFCTVLFHFTLLYSILYCFIPFCTVLFHFILLYSILYCFILYYFILVTTRIEFSWIWFNCIEFYWIELDASYWTLRWWL